MDKKVKDKLQELIAAKKKGTSMPFGGRQDVYKADGQPRKGVKRHKQGGLFDK